MKTLLLDANGRLIDLPNRDYAKDAASKYKIVSKKEIKNTLKEIITLNEIINSTSLINPSSYKELKECKQKRSELIEEIWEIYCEAKGIEYTKPTQAKPEIHIHTDKIEIKEAGDIITEGGVKNVNNNKK